MDVGPQSSKETRGVAVPGMRCVVKGRRTWAMAGCCVALLLLPQAARAREASFEVVHTFNPYPGGSHPAGVLLQTADGSFYGTTYDGGLGFGVIFRLTVGTAGLRLPGDCNADGRRNISDAVCLLGFLFRGAPQSLPCGSGLPEDGANLQLLDHNGDQRINLSDPVSLIAYHFRGGPPPRSGLDCLEILDCSDPEPACPR